MGGLPRASIINDITDHTAHHRGALTAGPGARRHRIPTSMCEGRSTLSSSNWSRSSGWLSTISLSVLRPCAVSADWPLLASRAGELSALGLFAWLVVWPGALRAQSVSTDDSAAQLEAADLGATPGLGILAGRPTVRVTRTESPPDIDGRLDDVVWQTAATITELVQYSPLEGEPATEDTEIYIAYDSQHLYFGFYLHYVDPSILRANRVDRDRAGRGRPDDDLPGHVHGPAALLRLRPERVQRSG